MENRLYLCNLGIKIFGGFAGLGGVIQTFQMLTQPSLDIKSILLSFPAWVVYVFVCLTIILIMLRERYKSMTQSVELLNVKLNEQNGTIHSLQQMMKIVPFKGRFFLTTEYLYNELGEYIQNNITIDSIEIKNTIEKKGMGNKRDSFVRLNIRGVISHKISTFHLLVAGDTIVNFEDINIQAFERVDEKLKKLCARIADNGQDSLLKQIVVSYDKVKGPGSIVDLVIEWCWPNMLNITDCDYTTLPNFLASTVKHLKMSLECKENIEFKSASIYKYKVGMNKAQLILDIDMSEITNTISYEEDTPLMNSTYILYYEVAK
jgi:hypothetical protein